MLGRASKRLMSTRVLKIAQGIDKNRVNSLGYETRKNLLNEINAANADPSVKAIVIAGSDHSSAFSAGADITEFNASGEFQSPSLHDLIETLESVQKPTVAAIKGVALGGGLELALACKYRVSDPRAKVGLPEVLLGIIPGAGGTQRLPRLSSVKFALDTITSGRMIKAKEAFDNNVLDGIAPDGQSVEEFASSFALSSASNSAEDLAARNLSTRSVSGDTSTNDAMCDAAKEKLPQPHMGGEAVHGAVDAIKASYESGKSFEECIETEMSIFMDLLANSAQGRARRHAFFAERIATGLPRGAPKPTSPLPNKVGVIGAGTMGAGIATCFLRAGYDVTLVDVNAEGLARGEKIVQVNLSQDVKRGRATQERADKNLSMMKTDTSLTGLSEVDMVVEAVFENMDLKKKIFKELDGIVAPHTILCTNTSTLDIDEIGGVVKDSSRTMGMHFFSPANVMKLVENVHSKHTSEQTISDVTAHTKKIGKIGVLVGNCFSFNFEIFEGMGDAVSIAMGLLVPPCTLDIDEIGGVVKDSSRTMGMHFFSPANVMKLVENVHSKHTSEQTISDVTAHTKKIGKIGVLVGNCDGFVGNRMVAPYTGEAAFCVEEGAGVGDVDSAIVDLGCAIGPFTMGDIAGNDIGYLIRQEKGWADGGAPAGLRYTDIPDNIVKDLGRIGQKAGKGWYDYDPKIGKGRVPMHSEEVETWLEKARGEGVLFEDKDLVERR
ncbi:hypothetical protein TL16_g01131 [Triparma laevis f. inornata]|uniref:Enoyl-CoA hydratase n=1 Tax=Triparma laevis f. inornata TaxID=1714386 RepID=A0A9W6ZG73_9STRA|nr:hypothetical protein TL16_g01131 [Triparma laevis f. inornata]